jgi:predicted metal-binding protein
MKMERAMVDTIRTEQKITKRIGIMTCANITQDLNCASSICLKDLRARSGQFAPYDDIELIGIINCAGCSGNLGANKLTNRIRALTELNLDAIHFSSCMINLCPFKEKYSRMLKEKYPDIEIVFGTHDPPEGVTSEIFVETVKYLISKPKPDLSGLMKPFV